MFAVPHPGEQAGLGGGARAAALHQRPGRDGGRGGRVPGRQWTLGSGQLLCGHAVDIVTNDPVVSVTNDPVQVVHGLVSRAATIPVTTLTHGHSEVTRLLAWDTDNNWM